MEYGLTREWLDDLRSRNDIVATISRYVPLQRKGRNYWGRCPFHHEKTASFSVDEGRQFYHCFGCGESGDVIKFIEKIESVDFVQAVKILADNAHMEIPDYKPNKVDSDAKRKRDAMLEINRLAARHYFDNLSCSRAADARAYLSRRGISEAMIKKFGIGYSVDFKDLVDHLQSNGCDLSLAVDGGLLGKKDDSKRYYDALGGRLIFPIIDSQGNVVAFGGRLLENSDQYAKYKNTGATFVFDKSKNIYGINLIKKLRLKQSVDTLILCEGYVDVVSLHQAGFVTAVASMGTALTKEQCRILARFAKTVIISYDGDAAGQKATLRGLQLLVEEGLTVKVLSLPDGLDPDDLIKQRGAQSYQACIDAAIPYFDFKLRAMAKDYNLNTFDGKMKYATAAVREIGTLPGTLEQDLYLKQVQRMTGYTYESLQRQLSSSVTEDGVLQTPIETKPIFSASEKAVRFLLFAFINRYPYVDRSFDLTDLLVDDGERSIYKLFADDSQCTVATAFAQLPESLHEELSTLAQEDQGIEADKQAAYYAGCYARIKKSKLERELSQLSEQYDNVMLDDQKKSIMSRILTINSELKKLSK